MAQKMETKHMFLLPEDEAKMEQATLFKHSAEKNNEILKDLTIEGLSLGLSSVDDPSLLFISVGSSSTQTYDHSDMAFSVPFGMKCRNATALNLLRDRLGQRMDRLQESGGSYKTVVLMNAIGYLLKSEDPCCHTLKELAAREAKKEAADKCPCTLQQLSDALDEIMPKAKKVVLNRCKDPKDPKKSLYQQVENDFSEALRKGGGLPGGVPDAIVDWGGQSYKVYEVASGERVADKKMDANEALVKGPGLVGKETFEEKIAEIEAFVKESFKNAGKPLPTKVFIVQTGKTREVAVSMGLESYGDLPKAKDDVADGGAPTAKKQKTSSV